MNEQIIFRKYSWDGNKQCLCPSYFEGIIEFTVDGEINITQGCFLTTNSFSSFSNSPQKAQEYLSITYYPSYLYEWKNNICKKLMENTSYEFKNVYGKKNSSSRIWPAFGKHGGGCEIIMTKGELQCPQAVKLNGCGEKDEYCQDSAKSDIVFASRLVEILYEWFGAQKGEDGKTPKTIGGKLLDGLGAVISWIGGGTGKRYAISCGYKEEEKGIISSLRFCGYVWQDDEIENRRSLIGPRTEDLPVDRLKKREILSYLRGEIGNILSCIHKDMVNSAGNFDSEPKEKIPLPGPEGIECISE